MNFGRKTYHHANRCARRSGSRRGTLLGCLVKGITKHNIHELVKPTESSCDPTPLVKLQGDSLIQVTPAKKTFTRRRNSICTNKETHFRLGPFEAIAKFINENPAAL